MGCMHAHVLMCKDMSVRLGWSAKYGCALRNARGPCATGASLCPQAWTATILLHVQAELTDLQAKLHQEHASGRMLHCELTKMRKLQMQTQLASQVSSVPSKCELALRSSRCNSAVQCRSHNALGAEHAGPHGSRCALSVQLQALAASAPA